jgi:hypothetical protein
VKKEKQDSIPFLFIILAISALSALMFSFVARYSSELPYMDQWDYLKPIFEGEGLLPLFTHQHGPHRSGLGLVVTALLYRTFGWDSRVESFAAVILLIASALAAVLLKKRLFGNLALNDVVIPFIFINLGAYETLTVVPQLANGPIPLLALLLTAYVLTMHHGYLREFLLLLLCIVLVFTGFGSLGGCLLAALLFLETMFSPCGTDAQNNALKLGTALASLAVLGAFLIGYHFDRAQQCQSGFALNPVAQLKFVTLVFVRWTGFYTDRIAWPRHVGPCIILVMFCFLGFKSLTALLNQPRSPRSKPIYFLLSAGILFAVVSAFGRICGDELGYAVSSRYMPYTMPAIFALYLLIQETKSEKHRRVANVIFVLLLAIGYLRNVEYDLPKVIHYHALKTSWTHCYEVEHDLGRCCSQISEPLHPNPAAANIAERFPLFVPPSKEFTSR